jgi:hypothetical protein
MSDGRPHLIAPGSPQNQERIMRRFIITKSFLGTALLALGMSIALPLVLTAAQEETVDVVLHVRNAANPDGGIEQLALTADWRVGGDDDDILFGQVIRAAVDGGGNVYLLDAQLCHVEVFSPEGEHLRTLSREGEGPGEIREPADMIFMPDGTFGILTRFPGRLTKLNADGDPVGQLTIGLADPTEGGFTAVHYGACSGENLIFVGNSFQQAEGGQNRNWYIGRFDQEGIEQVRYYERDFFVDFQQPKLVERDLIASFLFACAPAPDGRVYVAPHRHQYSIHVYESDGQLERVIERQFENRPRRDIEITRIRGVFEGWSRGRPAEMEFDIEETATTVTRLVRITGDGHLWVETSLSCVDQPAGVFETYDVFDARGHYVKQVAVSCPGDPMDDELFFLNDDLAVMIGKYHPTFYALMGRVAVKGEDEEEANIEVTCYKLPH